MAKNDPDRLPRPRQLSIPRGFTEASVPYPQPKSKKKADMPYTILNDFRLLVATCIEVFVKHTTKQTEVQVDPDTEASFFRFVHDFVIHNYGIRRVNDWLKLHPDKTFLHLITPQDLAYSILVYENNYAVFDYEVRNENAMLAEGEQQPTQPLTTSRRTRIDVYGCNWKPDAIQYYLDLEQCFSQLMQPANWLWVRLLNNWDEFHAGVKGSKMHQYRKTKRDDQRATKPSTSTVIPFIPFRPLPSEHGQLIAMQELPRKRGSVSVYETEKKKEEEDPDESSQSGEDDDDDDDVDRDPQPARITRAKKRSKV